jgi:hypothetical protein
LVARAALPAPALNEVAGVIELHHRGRGHGCLIMRNSVRAAENPDVIVCIDGDGGSESHFPLGRDLRPGGVLFELGQSSFSYVGGLRGLRGNLADDTDQNDCGYDETDRQIALLHGLGPQKFRHDRSTRQRDLKSRLRSVGVEDADFAQVAVFFGEVESVAHYEYVRDAETDVGYINWPDPAFGLVEKRGNADRFRLALLE